MTWLIAAYAAVLVGIGLFVVRMRRLRRQLTPPAERRPPRR